MVRNGEKEESDHETHEYGLKWRADPWWKGGNLIKKTKD